MDPKSLPGQRFCHVAVVYEDCLYVFGGYDGTTRLGDFIRFRFGPIAINCSLPPPTLINDLKSMLNNKEISDVVFFVEEAPIYANKVLLYLPAPLFNHFFVNKIII